VVDLGKKLQGTKCSEEDDVRAHFTKLNDLREQLSTMGEDVDDDEYSSILLGSLPPSYEATTSTINTASDLSGTDITSDIVTRLVNDEYNRRVIKKTSGKNGPEEAFAADGRKRNRSDAECYNCHRKGHYKSECWAKGGDKEGQRPPRRTDNNNSSDNSRSDRTRGTRNRNRNNRNDNANSADADIEAWAAIELSDDSLAAIEEIEDESQPHFPHTSYSAGHTHTHQPNVEIELYDSGASRHMSPYAKRFINYRSIPPRLITAANKGTFYTIGTGDLRIDVPNGKGTTPVILHDTLHAPEMALTIVSIGRITDAGYEATFGK
jgi:hypothetical protein